MSFYTSLSGLKNAQTWLNVTAHNIANAETSGFKKSRVQFGDVLAKSASTDPKKIQGLGSTVKSITQNYAMGPIEQSGSALDLAITGEGFFTLRSATGDTLYSRKGSFVVDEGGFVHDGSGNRLQIVAAGADPATATRVDAQISGANVAAFAGLTIGNDGSVTASYADGTSQTIGQVVLASFNSPAGLRQMGASNWRETGLSGSAQFGLPGQGAFGDLISGAVERSNVDIAEELVNLILAQRYFQANAKAMDTATQVTETAMNLRS